MQIEAEVARWLAYRVTSMEAEGNVPNHEASISKAFGSEMNQRPAPTSPPPSGHLQGPGSAGAAAGRCRGMAPQEI